MFIYVNGRRPSPVDILVSTVGCLDDLAIAMDRPGESATKVITELVATLPGVSKDHGEAGIESSQLVDFAAYLYSSHGERLNIPFG